MQRLQYIVSQPDLVMNATDYTGLEIVTCVGRHTHASRTFVLKSAVKQVLRQRHLQGVQGSNAGVVRVPLPSLQRYVQRELRQNLLLGFLQGAGWRYLTLFGGICSAVSAVVVVPKLLMVA